MYPIIWKTVAALLLLCILVQQFSGSDWPQHFHKKHFTHQQTPIGYDYIYSKPSQLGDWEYDWGRDRNSHALSAEQCDAAFPELYDDIDRAVGYWKDRNVTPDARELYEGNEAGVQILFKDQQLRIVQTRGMFREDFRTRIFGCSASASPGDDIRGRGRCAFRRCRGHYRG